MASPSLPGLALAAKIQKKAASAGFDWDGGVEVAYADVEAELAEVRDDPSEHEVGDLLFAGVQVARRLDVDPEAALRSAAQRFASRFRRVEVLAGSPEALAAADENQLTAWWAVAKSAESWQTDGPGTAEHPRARAVRAKSLTLAQAH